MLSRCSCHSRRADDGDHLAALDGEVDVGDSGARLRRLAIDKTFADLAEFDFDHVASADCHSALLRPSYSSRLPSLRTGASCRAPKRSIYETAIYIWEIFVANIADISKQNDLFCFIYELMVYIKIVFCVKANGVPGWNTRFHRFSRLGTHQRQACSAAVSFAPYQHLSRSRYSMVRGK
jgi:hypothetical protein